MGSPVTNDTLCYTADALNAITNPPVGRTAIGNIPIGPVAYGSIAVSAVHVAGTVYVTQFWLPRQMNVTNINVLQGATASTDNLIGVIYNSAGVVVQTSALAGVLQAGGASTFLVLPLIAATVLNAGMYYVGIQSNGTTGTTQRIAASTYIDILSKTTAGVFATLPALVVPTTFAAASAPVVYLN